MASSKPCSSRVVSLLALITTFACVLRGAAAERTCYLEIGGFLRTFNQEDSMVILPCKYRLADFTCGDYHVKVTPGNALDADNRYSPVTVWVKVANTVTNDTVKLRTSLSHLEKVEAGKIDIPWQIKDGNRGSLGFSSYFDGYAYVAYLEIFRVFKVRFSRRFVEVTCLVPEFSSLGVPETLCGDGFTANELETAKNAAFGDRSLSVTGYLQYVILNDDTVTQSENCAAMASDLQGCGVKYEAHADCVEFFNDPSLTQCLVDIGTSPGDAYDSCLRQICYDDDSDRPDLGDCI